MSGWAWNAWVLAAVVGLWLSSGTQREKPLFTADHTDRLRELETRVVTTPADEVAHRDLAQAYLDARAPGLAVRALESAPAAVRAQPRIEHVYARALAENGHTGAALLAQRRALAACDVAPTPCDTWFLVAATRRADVLGQLVNFGVEDVNAHPEISAIAYHNATRQARLAVR